MKILIVITILTSSAFFCSAEQPKKLNDLITLRNKKVAKIDAQFLIALEKLKIEYTKSGDLESANSVVSIIKNISSTDNPNALQLLDDIIGEWSFKYKGMDRVFKFTKDSKFIGRYPVSGRTFSGTWTRSGKNIFIQRANESKRFGKIRLDSSNEAYFESEGYKMLGEKK